MTPLPDKKYSIIYADPPWSYQNRGTRAAASKHYDTMTIEDIKRMGVGAAGGYCQRGLRAFHVGDLPHAPRGPRRDRGVGLQLQDRRLQLGKAEQKRHRHLHGARKLDAQQLRDLPAGDQGQAEAHQRQRPQRRPLPAPAAQQKAGRDTRQDRRADGRPAPYRAFRPRGCPGMGRVGQRSADA